MADQFAIATASSPTPPLGVPTTVDFTSPDITETVKAAIFIYGHSATDGSAQTHASLGAALWANDGDPSSELLSSHFFVGENGQTVSTDCRGFKSSGNLRALDSGHAIDVEVSAVAAISGGVRLTFGTGTTGGPIKITAILFAGLSRAWASIESLSTVLTSVDTGSISTFRPDMLVVVGSPGNFGALVDDFRAQIGFVVGSTHKGQAVRLDRGLTTPDADGIVDSGEVPFMTVGAAASAIGATFTLDATGYDTQLTTGTTTCPVTVLALKFSSAVRLATSNFAVSGSPGAQSFAVGFRPQLVLGMSSLISAEDSLTDGATASTATYFAFTDAAARAYGASHNEGSALSGAAPSLARSIQGDFALLALASDGSVAQQATLTSMSATGFNLSFATATAGRLSALALGFFEVDGESIQISDGAVLDAEVTTGYIIGAEVVQISDAVALDETDIVHLTGQEPLGRTAQAGAQRGSTIQAGPALGRTL